MEITLARAVVQNVDSPTGDGVFTAGDVIQIDVEFGVPVDVTGLPQLVLATGAQDRVAVFRGMPTPQTVRFAYTVAPDDSTTLLTYFAPDALVLPLGASITAQTGEAANLTLLALGSPGSLSANRTIVLDGGAPTLIAVASPNVAGRDGAGQAITVELVFSEAMTVTGSPQLTLNSGGIATFASGDGNDRLSFSYTVQASDSAPALDVVSVALNGGAVVDAGGSLGSISERFT